VAAKNPQWRFRVCVCDGLLCNRHPLAHLLGGYNRNVFCAERSIYFKCHLYNTCRRCPYSILRVKKCKVNFLKRIFLSAIFYKDFSIRTVCRPWVNLTMTINGIKTFSLAIIKKSADIYPFLKKKEKWIEIFRVPAHLEQFPRLRRRFVSTPIIFYFLGIVKKRQMELKIKLPTSFKFPMMDWLRQLTRHTHTFSTFDSYPKTKLWGTKRGLMCSRSTIEIFKSYSSQQKR
jgi:hypothetical protein